MLFLRPHAEQTLVVAMNFTDEPISVDASSLLLSRMLEGHGFEGALWEGQHIALPPYGAAFFEMEP